MNNTQAELKAIQAKLQALQAGRSQLQQPQPTMWSIPAESTNGRTTGATAIASRLEFDSLPNPAETLSYQASPQAAPQSQPSQHRQQLQLSLPQEALEEQIANEMKRLEVQAQRINQLSAAQENAMRELKAIAEKVERTLQSADAPEEFLVGAEVCEYLATLVPHMEQSQNGAFVLTTREVDLFRAEREAALNAKRLRRQGEISNRMATQPQWDAQEEYEYEIEETDDFWSHWSQTLRPWMVHLSTSVGQLISTLTPSRRTRRTAQRQVAQPPQEPVVVIRDAVIWVLGATVARIGIDLLLAAVPALLPAVVMLIIAPAAIAIYKATVAPQTGFALGYRLLLTMIGLLLGGRL